MPITVLFSLLRLNRVMVDSSASLTRCLAVHTQTGLEIGSFLMEQLCIHPINIGISSIKAEDMMGISSSIVVSVLLHLHGQLDYFVVECLMLGESIKFHVPTFVSYNVMHEHHN